MSPKVVVRNVSPITGHADNTHEVISVPYSCPALAKTCADNAPLPLQQLAYTIRYDAATDLYWQTHVYEGADLPQSAKENESHHTPPNFERHAYHTEEAILYRLMLKDKLPEGQKPVVYDFGMGEGWWGLMMLAYGMEPHGYDVAAYSRTVAQRHGIVFAPLESYPDNTFDVINIEQVLEHVTTPLAVMKLLKAKLKPHGIIRVAVPGAKGIVAKLKKLKAGGYDNNVAQMEKDLDCICPIHHINLFSARSLRAIAAAAGLQQLRIGLDMHLRATLGPFSAKQLTRNWRMPLKRATGKGTLQYFTKAE